MSQGDSNIHFTPYRAGVLARTGWHWDQTHGIFGDPGHGQVMHVMFWRDGAAQNDQMLRVEKAPGCFVPMNAQGEVGLVQHAFRPQVRDLGQHLSHWPYQRVEDLTDNLGRRSWEFPRGYAKSGETGEQAARREGAEETGSQVIASITIGQTCGNTALEPHFMTVNVGLVDPFRKVEGDPNERLVRGLTFFSREDLREMIAVGLVYCQTTLAALALLDALDADDVLEQLLRQ